MYCRRLIVRAALVPVVLALGVSTSGQGQSPSLEEIRGAIYEIDSSQPLNADVSAAPKLKDEAAKISSVRSRYKVIFDSVNDQRVPCILTLPLKAKAPFPAVLLLAGSGGHKDTDYVRLTSDMLNTMGFATLSIDAQYHGERSRTNRSGDIHLIHHVTERDAWIQTVRDLRRAVDYLISRKDVDRTRIGFVGFSQGGMIGGTFIGVEPRIRAAVLAIPGGGFADWAVRAKMVQPNDMERLRLGAALTDPVHFIGRFAPRPLLVLSARKDELIPAYATEALWSAAAEPKEIKWYNSGHVLPPTALLVDARAFLKRHLGSTSAP